MLTNNDLKCRVKIVTCSLLFLKEKNRVLNAGKYKNLLILIGLVYVHRYGIHLINN